MKNVTTDVTLYITISL